MSKRYFKATDGDVTYFRASGTRVYQSALKLMQGTSFSSTPANLMAGSMPAKEITKAEYNALLMLKLSRCQRAGTPYSNGPQHSWVANDAIPGTPAEHPEDAALRRRLSGTPASREPHSEEA